MSGEERVHITGGSKVHHTDPDCPVLPQDSRDTGLTHLSGHRRECMWCSGEKSHNGPQRRTEDTCPSVPGTDSLADSNVHLGSVWTSQRGFVDPDDRS